MLYRKVLIGERRPKSEGHYYTDQGDMLFAPAHSGIPDGWSIDISYQKRPSWWLETVKEPTDEEIKGKSSAKCKERMNAVWPLYQVGYEDGYKQALKDLNG